MFPHMPPDGQLVSLQFRLMRAARAFLDPELHMGRVSRTRRGVEKAQGARFKARDSTTSSSRRAFCRQSSCAKPH
jgi:hypothetical protein